MDSMATNAAVDQALLKATIQKGRQCGDVASPVNDVKVLEARQHCASQRHQQNDESGVDGIDQPYGSVAAKRSQLVFWERCVQVAKHRLEVDCDKAHGEVAPEPPRAKHLPHALQSARRGQAAAGWLFAISSSSSTGVMHSWVMLRVAAEQAEAGRRSGAAAAAICLAGAWPQQRSLWRSWQLNFHVR